MGGGKHTARFEPVLLSYGYMCNSCMYFFKSVYYSVYIIYQTLPDARSANPSFTFLAHKCAVTCALYMDGYFIFRCLLKL